ncbi:hypothetical protein AB2B41_18580 [Marimonas sp. MJW-29]|uniref:Uncharacterized protein n=1 Tax=Sulfitobacter sediminis TaxID=3234186 RepID=A0ABV3RRI2_9RHOB
MAAFFRPLRRFGVFFLILLTILLIARQALGFLANGSTYLETEIVFGVRTIDTVLLILSLTVTVVVSLFLYAMVIYLVALALRALMRAPIVAETQPINKLFGLVAVALFFGNLLETVLNKVLDLIIVLFANLSFDVVGHFRNALGCIDSNAGFRPEGFDYTCITGMFSDTAQTLRRMAFEIFGSGGLGGIDPVALVGAVAVFYLVTIATSRVRSDLAPKEQFWLAYGAVAFFATYLTLSAILAVPLLSEETSIEPRPAEDLRVVLEEMVPAQMKEAEEDTGGAEKLTDLLTDEQLKLTEEIDLVPGDREIRLSEVANTIRRTARELDGRVLSVRLAQLRLASDASQTVNAQLKAAVLVYEAEVGVRRGHREANRHFVDLTNWFQRVLTDTSRMLGSCEALATPIERGYQGTRDGVLQIVTRGHDGTPEGALDMLENVSGFLEDELFGARDPLNNAQATCESPSTTRYTPPNRREYGSFLGVVGLAASWLLSTESMEVTLITGLIGFGLLGALVAQFVKSGGRQEFDMARIATVVFSGFCAAIVVYVGAYGGLAIASTDGSDPNPYVVFGACLVGAVFSAEIWERAKKWFLGGGNGDGGDGGG